MIDLCIRALRAPEHELSELRAEAAAEGFAFLDRLVSEWVSGANRFERPGEQLLGAFGNGGLVAVCGLNRDPYTPSDDIGRLRRLYVRPASRHEGVGRALVERLLDRAAGHFAIVRLRTDTRQAAAFYVTLGFQKIEDAHASHAIALAARAARAL